MAFSGTTGASEGNDLEETFDSFLVYIITIIGSLDTLKKD
ncbi:MAG: hypothetical protein PWQ31_1395 [Eubacteriales bacterium]|nr:hypothetical protein [Eubacteriales bacterium]